MKKRGGLAKAITEVIDTISAPGGTLPAEFRKICEHDYRRALRRTFFTAREARRILNIFMKLLPELNSSITRKPSQKYLRELAARAGVELKATSFGKKRRNLRGFYIPGDGTLGNAATICLNTDYKPVAVVATAYHEVAHHIVETRIAPARRSIAVNVADDYVEQVVAGLQPKFLHRESQRKVVASQRFVERNRSSALRKPLFSALTNLRRLTAAEKCLS